MDDERCQLLCRLLWTLCRKHAWADPLPLDQLLNLALDRSDQGRGRLLVSALVREPYIESHSGTGYRLKNDPDAQAQAAFRLRSSCGYHDIQIEPTLSRFAQAGGFDAYDEAAVLAPLDAW